MSALEKRDEDSFGSLFCETAKKSDVSFSSSVSNFFQFYQREMARYTKADYYILDSTWSTVLLLIDAQCRFVLSGRIYKGAKENWQRGMKTAMTSINERLF